MKIKITRKQVVSMFSRVYSCGYCELYPLYSSSDADYYNCGVYGWNYHVYTFGRIAITSGYRGMFGADLPAECVRILKNAKKYCSVQNLNGTTAKKEKYLERARREFEKALNNA